MLDRAARPPCTQRLAQETRQNLEKQTAIADIQKQIVQADQGVQIAEIIGRDHVKVMPDILIPGGSNDSTNGPLAGLLGMKLMQELGGGSPPPAKPAANPAANPAAGA